MASSFSFGRAAVPLFVSALLLVTGACSDDGAAAPTGTPAGATTTATVGSAGGTVASADGRLEIVIPEGALPADTSISVQPIAGTAPGGLGEAYRLGKPDAVSFAKPVTLRFKLTEAEVAGTSPEYLAVGWQTPSGAWQTKPSTVADGSRVISAETTHFSDWSAVSGLQLLPGNASVRVGETVRLGVRYCTWTKESEDVLCPLGQPCKINACEEARLTGVTAKDWAVNGAAGGSDKTGRVVGDGTGGTFTAPSKAPSPATVAVSVSAIVGSKAPTKLVSNVTITDAETYEANMTFTGLQGGFITNGKAKLTYKQFEDLPDTARYEITGGQFEATFNYPDCDPVPNVVIPTALGESDGGELVVSKPNNAAGKNYFFGASSTVIEIQASCGDPRAPMAVPVTVNLNGQGVYEDPKAISGSGTTPLGGTITWQFTRP